MLINGRFRCAGCMRELNSETDACSCGFSGKANLTHCLPIGTVLNDSYVVGKVLGEGGFGITYIAWDKNLNIKVAVKEFYMNGCNVRNATVSATVTANAGETENLFLKGRDKFVKEAEILASCRDEDGIVSVYNYFKENNTAYIVMEFVEGQTLKDLLKQKGRLSAEEAVGLLESIMVSLATIHEKNLVHRDISPDNIMILSDGSTKLIDFGAARELGDGNKSLSVVLKQGYAPIEQYQSKGKQGPWTDVYALCATIYYCITGVVPLASADRVIEDEVKAASELSGCGNCVSDVIMKGLSVVGKDRFQDVLSLSKALQDAIAQDSKKAEKLAKKQHRKQRVEESGERKKADHSIRSKKSEGFLTDETRKTTMVQEETEDSPVKQKKALKVWALIAVLLVFSLLVFVGAKYITTDLLSGVKEVVGIPNDVAKEKIIPEQDTQVDKTVGDDVLESIDDEIQEDTPALSDNTEEQEVINNSIEIGDIVTFGEYSDQPIEWQVLDVQDGKALVISKYALDNKAFHKRDEIVTWESCSLRTWLNGEFLETAFSKDERDSILDSQVADASTNDRIFLLSEEEAKEFFSSDEERCSTFADGTPAFWWLRSRFESLCDLSQNCLVNGQGTIIGSQVYYSTYAVRPAMWIDIATNSFQSVQKGNKQKEVNGSLSNDNPNTDVEIDENVVNSDSNKLKDILVKTVIDDSIEVGDYVKLGNYEGNTDWLVLEKKEGKALIISRYAIKQASCKGNKLENTWENSGLRFWLNSDYIQEAFAKEEQALILMQVVSSVGNKSYHVTVGNNTKDNVFLLSIDQANSLFSSDYERITTLLDGESVAWWLRNPGPGNEMLCSVSLSGEVRDDVVYSNDSRIGVRPVMWIDTSSTYEYIDEREMNSNNTIEDNDIKDTSSDGDMVSVGDILSIGNYKNNQEWVVLDKKDGKALLLSRYVIEEKNYNDTLENITWADCSLRKWLNSTYFDEAFSNSEKDIIVSSQIANESGVYGTSAGDNTVDKIFILSRDEYNKYSIPPVNLLEGTSEDNIAWNWWLRTLGNTGQYAAYVDAKGEMVTKGWKVNEAMRGQLGMHNMYGRFYTGTQKIGVRPAMWIDISPMQYNEDR